MEQAETVPQRLEQDEIRRFHSMMLLDHAATEDRENARTLLGEALATYRQLLGEALATYRQIGMPRHTEMTQTLLARCR
jgi:hypothetical protein